MLQAHRRAQGKSRLYLTAWFVTAREAYDKHERRSNRKLKKKKKRTKTTVGAPPPRDGVRPASCVLLNLGHIHNRLHYKIPKLIYFTSSTR